jgi:hypothetical protein
MWHVLWGVPSRMTVKGESMFLRESPVKWIAAAVMTKHHLLAMTLAERTHSYHKESLVKWIAASVVLYALSPRNDASGWGVPTIKKKE